MAGLGEAGREVLLAAVGSTGAELAPPGYGFALLKLLGALVLVCVAAYAILFLLRRQLQAARRLGPASLRIVERLPLSNRHNLYLVEAGGRYFLLGAGEGAAPSRLAELDPPPLDVARGDGDRRRSFWQILHGRAGPQPPPDEARAAADREEPR